MKAKSLLTILSGLILFLSSVVVAADKPSTLPPLKNAKGDIFEEPLSSEEFRSRVTTGAKAKADQPSDWFNADPEIDGIEGSSIDKAYDKLSITDTNSPVIVAVIDSGVDIHHEDLEGKIWVNEDEIPDNGIDDDSNGYIDDIYGWNYIGGKDGSHIKHDTYEVTREYKSYQARIDNGEVLTSEEQEYFNKVKEDYLSVSGEAIEGYQKYYRIQLTVTFYQNVLGIILGMDDFSKESLEGIGSNVPFLIPMRDYLLDVLAEYGSYGRIDSRVSYYETQVFYYYSLDYDSNDIVQDDPDDPYEHDYGNNDVIGPIALHGTHVSGIIAACRGNGLGIDGVADNVRIMALKVVPDGDEKDKHVANAVIYAVDNGARIINMSFGKDYSPLKEVVDQAFSYAVDHDVLLVNSAGNSAENNDVVDTFPNRYLNDNKTEELNTWISVGASDSEKGDALAASFSCYGKETVELFAPGKKIYSTTPNNKYSSASGTSMAAPVVAGVAALILSQQPDLTALELKDLLLESGTQYPGLDVKQPGSDTLVPFSSLSMSGVVVNGFNSLNQ